MFSQGKGADWWPFRLSGYDSRDTTIAANTKGVAGVQVIRRGQGDPVWASYDSDIHFTFVMQGRATLEGEGQELHALEPGDAFVIPPGMKTRLSRPYDDIELLEVTLPEVFNTEVVV